ncbi:hypothetical protein PTKIN_Ptkin11bG0164100 [Pterospermum kingtungense]
MECKKHGFLLAAMVVLLLVIATPITFAARNQIVAIPVNTNDLINNIRNPFPDIFLITEKSAEDCIPKGGSCSIFENKCCSGWCQPIPAPWRCL